MPENQTEENFTRHLKTMFCVRLDAEHTLELELEEIQPFPSLVHARGDMERFSLYFRGPRDMLLPQRTYRIEHERMGEMDIFLVPIAQDANGFRYEAVFSYFKSD